MQKIDRLGWATGLSFIAYGLKIGVRVNVPEMPPEVLACLPPCWEPAPSNLVDYLYSIKISKSLPGAKVRQFNLLYTGLHRLGRNLDLSKILEFLETDLQRVVAEHAKDRIFVHAGVVSWKGRAILIPARSFSGKSTLVKALVQAGATYHSDEYAVLDDEGLVHPYPRRMVLRQPDGQFPKRVSAEELGGTTAREPLPVGLVVLTKYQEGARWQPRPATAGKAVMELLDNTIAVQRQPERTLNALHRLIPGARALKGVRGNAEDMVDALLQAVT